MSTSINEDGIGVKGGEEGGGEGKNEKKKDKEEDCCMLQ